MFGVLAMELLDDEVGIVIFLDCGTGREGNNVFRNVLVPTPPKTGTVSFRPPSFDQYS